MALKKGDRGDAVKKLQREINDAGYKPPLVVDGIYGPKTQAGSDWFDKQEEGSTSSSGDVKLDTGEPDQYTDDVDSRFVGLGSHPEIWYNSTTGESYVVYFVPGTEPPVPAFWRIDKDAHLEAYFNGKEVKYDRVVSTEEMTSTGALYQGLNTELTDRGGDPMAAITERIKRDMEVRPYLKDPEVAAVIMAAALEGVDPTTELEKTEWYRTHTAGEKAWLVFSASDPKTAQQVLESKRIAVRNQLIKAGMNAPPESLVNYLADQQTTGLWDDTYLTDQINKVADPAYAGTLDAGVSEFISNLDEELDYDQDEEKWVRDNAIRQLGPVHGVLTDEQVTEIAGRIRNDPNYRDEWVTSLQSQRMALYPAYTDPTTSYDEFAQPWRSVYFQTLGETPDETSDEFQAALQRNDLTETKRALRTYGLKQGNEKVTHEAFGALADGLGGGVRRVV
jgi:peptidoglycan hydrolase-like protein with peptidoglycan-binding domain